MKTITLASSNACANDSSTRTPSPAFTADPLVFNHLLRKAAQGDSRALGTIATEQQPALLAVARSVVRDGEDPEDLLQDFYVILLSGKAARCLPGPGDGIGWVQRLMRGLSRVPHEERSDVWGVSDPDSFDRAPRFRRRPDP